jgi:chromosome segregation ATPase
MQIFVFVILTTHKLVEFTHFLPVCLALNTERNFLPFSSWTNLYMLYHLLKFMSSQDSLESRLTELTRQLNQKDAELDQAVDDIIAADFEALDADIEADKKELREGLKQKVEAVKKGIKDKKDDLKQKVEAAKTGAKDHARKEAEDSLNRMEEHLSNGDLVSAHVSRWVASQWLKASK